MKNNILPILKMRYNSHIKRNMTIKEYFKTHNVKQCLKYLEILNKGLQELNNIAMQIETLIGKEISEHEKIKGFELGGE